MDNVRQLHPNPPDTTTAQVPAGNHVAYATFTLDSVDIKSLGFHFTVRVEPRPGVVREYTVVIGYGAEVLDSMLSLRDHRLPVALHYNPIVGATKSDGTPYGLHEIPLETEPHGLYYGHPGTFVPLASKQL